MKKRISCGILIMLSVLWFVWARTYTFDTDLAANYLTAHGRMHSKSWCAWYTMRALQAGGCPAILLPAQWYSWFMPLVGFDEVSKDDYTPRKGDVVVFKRPAGAHLWGHIAMYSGTQWISDFKQKRMSPYKKEQNVPYRLFRSRRQR